MRYVKSVAVFTLILLGLFCLYFSIMKYLKQNDYPTVLGYGNAIVISGSMEPAISVNDLVITKKQATYEKRDIILFHSNHSLVTHRIIEVQKNRYLTQGDANNSTDGWVATKGVEGKVVGVIPKVGYIQEFFSTKMGKIGLYLILSFAIIVAFDNKPKD
ncbi:signal peptidase I [Erwinia sp. CPCC 100877]|nr:signal peptidase I [Erwinia sp. CPCC 100877]